MVLLLKQWKSRSSPGFETGVSENPFAMFQAAAGQPSGGFFVGAGWSSPVARQAHNLKVAGSNPAPATNQESPFRAGFYCRTWIGGQHLQVRRKRHANTLRFFPQA